MRRLIRFTLLTLIPAAAAGAQTENVRFYDELRVTSAGTRVQGLVAEIDPRTLVLRAGRDMKRIERQHIDSVFIRTSYAGAGAETGAIGGGLVLGLMSMSFGSGMCHGCGDEGPAFAAGALAGAVVGGVVGAIVGSMVPKWKRVDRHALPI